jgi:hypothetical protein
LSFLRSLLLPLLVGSLLASSACSRHEQAREGAAAERQAPLVASAWPAAGIVAKNSIAFARDARFTGDIAVINRATGAVLNTAGVELDLGRGALVTGNVKADTLSLAQNSRITGSAAFNVRSGQGVISGATSTPLSLPLAIDLPSLPSIVPGDTAVTVAVNGTRTLAPGAYAAVKANDGATLTLSGGIYQLQSLAVGSNALVQCSAACEIRVQSNVDIAGGATLGAASGSGLGAFDVQLITAFTSTSPGGTAAIDAGEAARLTAYVYAPNGTAKLRQNVILNGKLAARDVDIARNTIAAQLDLPVITQQPPDVSINDHQQAVFSVGATGTALKYQWLRGSSPIAGATNATFTLAQPVAADSGATFQARVINAAGTVLSRAATLTVRACLASDQTCNNVDDDCDGLVDDDYVSSVTQCGVGACRAAGTKVCQQGAEQDTCVAKPPAASDASCDGVDDDCNAQIDEDYVPHPTQCGVGSCAASGVTSCASGLERDSCTPGIPAPSDASCDGVDQNCNGLVDEGYIALPTTCGVGACAASGESQCAAGQVTSTCQPRPAAPTDATCDGIDDDCSGQTDEDYVALDTSCGSGVCQRNGRTSCLAGHAQDSCTPGTPAANDATCDGIDSNCDGAVDEHYEPRPTSCGLGACARTGVTSCAAGSEHDSCVAGAPAANDASCNGVDDDCDGQIDEDFASAASSCGVGACAATGVRACNDGKVTDSCSPGAAAASDLTCDGIDDDCDGQVDENFVGAVVACGVGACQNSGQVVCRAGVATSECAPKPAAATDTSCDGVDDDCDGQADEDFVPHATTCGSGSCARTGILSCTDGASHDSCQGGAAAANDASCNGLDDDCDGQIDEDFRAEPASCGVGACVAVGSTRCDAGTLLISCTPAQPAGDDATCDGIDDDCDGQIDENFAPSPHSCGVGACASMGSNRCENGSIVGECTPAPAALDDTTCNGIDDDCDGQTDEDFAPAQLSCGVGACARNGLATCTSGQLGSSCAPGVPGGSDSTCDGVDDNCNGQVDEGFVPIPTSCGEGSCRGNGVTTCLNGALSNSCTPGTPGAEDALCDGVDADCDGQIDEDYAPHPVSCGLGACRTQGVSSCQAGHENEACSPRAPVSANDESCNGIDDDCDGSTDEDFTSSVTHCGVGACARSGATACAAGGVVDDCAAGAPATSDATCDGTDDDCDGLIDEDFIATPSSCGVGACAASGQTRCVSGRLADDCTPHAAAADDRSCNGLDDDCDGQVDEDYLAVASTCGVGACVASGFKTCQAGAEHDSCAPGTASPTDASCNGRDDDCDGQVDEDFVPEPSNCGVGACARQGTRSCQNGSLLDSCAAAAPADLDTTCNAIDDDCDGETDEDFASLPISCGVGACTASGARECRDGALHDTCTPLPTQANDDDCNGVDDDCDGSTDEGFVGSPTSCGQGACRQEGVTSCVAGLVLDSCSPGTEGGLDSSCDGVDADCDGQVDEDYLPLATTCGVGVCAASGVSSCQGGVELTGCTPGHPLGTRDESCDGADQDCDGQVDEDFPVTSTQCGVGACRAMGQWTCVAGQVLDSCAPSPAGANDSTCDGVDDDCDGQVDEDFVGAALECGVGACHATGAQTCANGAVVAQCSPGVAAASDTTCNGTDDDCDGAIDEDYVPPATTCGLGACQAAGVLRCNGGQAISDCAPREPASADATCNGVDDDCDGVVDEDYVPSAIQCGIGACKADGSRRCQAGAETDDCSPQVAALSDDTCDGVDNDCDGASDEDYIATATTCGVGACASSGHTSCSAGIVSDSCSAGPAATNDASCNGIDDDCDGTSDEDFLAQPTTCGAGSCTSSGSSSCVGGHIVDSCVSAGGTAVTDEICNGIDDDCDGATDEDYAPSSVSCGVGACAATGTTACDNGHVASQCSPGTPAATDVTCDGIDDDCDGTSDEDYAAETTQCGVGACHASGTTACIAGHVQNSCSPGTPASNDATCNGSDDDCDGAIDEDYQGLPTSCGVGACSRSAVSICSNGTVLSACEPGTPSADDASCNGVDDDCDGATDEEFASRATSCGVGACAAAGTVTCQLGAERDSCVPGAASASDDSCNGRDDDCNGEVDEDFLVSASQCGTGACARSGSKTCAAGQVQDSCNPGSPAADDRSCNGLDDDCNGEADEDFVETSTQCGVGNCRTQGTARCQAGSIVDSCQPLPAAATDDDCDGQDDDCDEAIDEEFQPHVTSCGVGVCRAEGIVTCQAGQVHDSCAATTATGPDTNCNGIDEDCDGSADQNYTGNAISCGIGACRANGSTICTNGGVVSVCTPLPPAGADDTCNGIDENCNGSVDEGYGVRCNGAAVERCSLGALQLTQCVDQNLCNGDEICTAGSCHPGTAPPLDDQDPCTADACDALLGVSHQPAPRGTACGPGKACDGAGGCDSLPVIVQGPQSLTVDLGQPLTLAVSATGAGLSYQWRRTGQDILGATQATYVLQAASAAENGVEFSVVVSNTAGSVTSSAALITVHDSIGPQLDVDGPSSRTVSTDSVNIAGSAHDPDSPVASVVVGSDRYPNEFAAILNGTTGAFSAEIPLKLGDNLLSVRARDAQGNVSTRTLLVTLAIDLLPRIQITEPVANSLSSTELVAVRGIVRSTFKPDEIRLVLGNDVRFPSGENGEYTFEFTGVRLQRGTNLLTVRAETRAGNSSAQVSVNYGVPPAETGVAPIIRLVGVQSESFTSADKQLISGIVSATRCVSSITVNDLAATMKGTGSQVSFDYLQPLQPGDSSVEITVKALDCDGRSAELKYSILHDDVAPSFSLALTPAPAEHRFSQTPVTVSGSITEGHLAGLSTNQQSLSVLPGADGRWDFNVAIPLTRTAVQTITFEAWDRAGNRGTYTVKLGLDAAFDVDVLTPSPDSEIIALESSTLVDVVARVLGLPSDASVTAAVDSQPGIQLTRGSNVFSGQLSVSGVTSKHTLTVVARRADGSALAQKTVPFSVKAASDIPLEVHFDNPLNGRQNVEANQPVVLAFNRPVTLSELGISVEETAHGKQYRPLDAAAGFAEFNNVQLVDVDREHAPVAGGLSLLPGGQAIIFYPTRDYAYGGTVTVTVKRQDSELGRASFDIRPLPTLLSGLVMDQGRTPLQGITVSLPDLGLNTLTDADGGFSFGFGTFDKAIPAGRHRLVVNPSLQSANYGNLIRYADTQVGRRVDLGVLPARLLDRSEPFRHIGSGGAQVSFLGGAGLLDLTHAELLFPDGRAEGNVQAEVIWGPGLGFRWPRFALPLVSMAFQPMGVEVAGSLGLDFALPPHPDGQDYAGSLPDRALVIGVDTRSLELVPVGVVRLERETARYKSEGPLALTRLDMLALAPVPDPTVQELLRGYGAGDMTLTELISRLGALP